MLQLDLEDTRTGMVIGQDVLDANGQLLLKAGTALMGKHLEMLRAEQIHYIFIQSSQPAIQAARSELTEIEAQLDNRFRLCDERQPLIHELRRLCRGRLCREQGDTE